MLKMIIAVSLVSSFPMLNASFSLASEINLPRSGQTTSYGTGDDGAIQAGQPWPSPRFTVANGAVTDNLTGLIWLQNANCSATLGGVAKTTTLTWDNALPWSNNLASGNCGLTDDSTAGQWRLPTRHELESLVDAAKYTPALPTGHPFTAVQTGNYWSSSTLSVATAYAWNVNMDSGGVGTVGKGSKYFVWPVRGGQ